jgi:hypothetical protein
MDPLGPHPLIRSFERHLYAENRSSRTVTGYLVAVRQADTFLRERGTRLETATRGDLEAFLGDLLSRRKASTAATYHKVLKILYGWLRKRSPGQPDGQDQAAIVPGARRYSSRRGVKLHLRRATRIGHQEHSIAGSPRLTARRGSQCSGTRAR